MAKPADSYASASHDRAIWAEAMRGVTPLAGRRRPRLERGPDPPDGAPPEPSPAAPAAFGHVPGLDRANAERLKRGRLAIEARLDLHGRTQSEAHHDLVEFVEASYRGGRRCVLVITGRGLGPDGPGVLKSAVPRWLGEAELSRRLLGVATAQPRHGGAGALYLLLRRRR